SGIRGWPRWRIASRRPASTGFAEPAAGRALHMQHPCGILAQEMQGSHASSAVARPDIDPRRVLARAALRAASVLEVPQRVLAEIIGVSASTVSRAALGGAGIDPDSKPG